MTPIERTIAVLNRWCGENAVDDTDEKLEDLWNRTKPTGKPSHSAIDFYPPGAEDLIDRLIAEFKKPPAFEVNITYKDLQPGTASILTVKNLLKAVSQFKPVAPATLATTLTPEAHDAIVTDVVARLTPYLAKVSTGKAPLPIAPNAAVEKKGTAQKAAAPKSRSRRKGGDGK